MDVPRSHARQGLGGLTKDGEEEELPFEEELPRKRRNCQGRGGIATCGCSWVPVAACSHAVDETWGYRARLPHFPGAVRALMHMGFKQEAWMGSQYESLWALKADGCSAE